MIRSSGNGEKHPHPNPIKAADGRTKTRLIEDPVYGPVIGQIYRWRVSEHLGKPTIRARLAAGPHAYPPPGPTAGWSLALVDEILSNPKYTGHQVMGRRRKGGKKIWAPPQEWIWTPEPTHPVLVDKATWDRAQRMGRRHGNVRDPEMPTQRNAPWSPNWNPIDPADPAIPRVVPPGQHGELGLRPGERPVSRRSTAAGREAQRGVPGGRPPGSNTNATAED